VRKGQWGKVSGERSVGKEGAEWRSGGVGGAAKLPLGSEAGREGWAEVNNRDRPDGTGRAAPAGDSNRPGEAGQTGHNGATAFGLDAFSLDDRMRLFGYVTADNRTAYLWILRVFDRERAAYHVLLHNTDVARGLDALAEEHSGCPSGGGLDLSRLLDALVEWGVLDRSQDGARAATVAEYRNRHSVYQFTEAGYRAHRAVESVLGASLAEANLSRLVFPDILADLDALAEANRTGDSEEVVRKLSRLDRVLSDMAERAARFYLMLGDLARTNDSTPEVFLTHKDALLSHLRDFHLELQRFTPLLRQAVEAVETTGIDRLIAHAAKADERLFRTDAERLDDWRRRWLGLHAWFAPAGLDRPSEADRMADAAVGAISNVLALLRRVTEARRGGVSRESQLRHLAAWFAATPSETAAHALFDVAFGLSAPRHVGVAHAAPDSISTRGSWWEAPAVELERTLVEAGKTGGPGRPAAVARNEVSRQRIRGAQLVDQRKLAEAAAALAETGAYDDVLDETRTTLLLRLVDLALAARRGGGPARVSGAAHGVRLTLAPVPGTTTVRTCRGWLHLDGYAVEIKRLDPARVRAERAS
jgi:uncharacterized protein (TIGR02677 family)